MLGAASRYEATECKTVEKDACLCSREILAVIRQLAAADRADKPPDRAAIIPEGVGTAQPPGDTSSRHLLPCHPVDEEHDMPCFFAHQHVEDLEQRLRQKSGPPRNLEHA